MFKKIIDKTVSLYNKETPLKIEWIIAAIIGVIMLCAFTYNDIESLTIWSTNLWDVIARGEIQNYYEYTSLNIYNVPHQYVSGTLYSLIIWAIWNLPIWIIQFFFNKSIVENAVLMLWSKLFLVFALGLTIFFAYKIVIELTKNKKKAILTAFLALTYLYTYIGVFYAGQNDILICLLGTIATYCFIKNKKKLFYILSSFAISVKYFFFLPYVAVILLTEKKIGNIIKKILYGLLPTIIFQVVCRNLPMFLVSSEAGNPMQFILDNMLCSTFPVANGFKLSLFIMAMIVLYIIAFITKAKNEDERNHFIIYLMAIPILIMCTLSTNYEFYRLIQIMPWIFILYMIKPKIFRINIILDTIIAFSSIISKCLIEPGVFSTISMENTIISRVFNKGITEVNSVYSLLNTHLSDVNLIGQVMSTIMFACVAVLIIINYPRFELKNIGNENEKCERYIIWIRMLIIIPFIAYPILKVICN